MNEVIAFIHTHAVEMMAIWAVCSVILSALPTPEAFAAYYEMTKCPGWYKTLYAIGHFLAMNWGRVVPGMRLASADKKGGGNAPA